MNAQHLEFSQRPDEPANGKGHQNYATPKHIVHVSESLLHLNCRLPRDEGFTVDVAASSGNAKAPKFYTQDDNGLMQSWAGEVVWCNPPYADIYPWVLKAIDAGSRAICLLVPASPCTKWFQLAVSSCQFWYFFESRIRFVQPPGQDLKKDRPRFDNALFIYSSTNSERSVFGGYLPSRP